MHYNHIVITFLLWLPCLLHAVDWNLMSTSATGSDFAYGAGWNGVDVSRLQINDGGDVCFLAPMPEQENSVAARFVASYANRNGVVSRVHSGLDEISAMFGMALRTTNTEIAASHNLARIAVLCDERLSSASAATAAVLYLQEKGEVLDRLVLGQSPGCLAAECHLQMGDGRLLVHGHGYGVKLFDITSGKLRLLHDLSSLIEYNGDVLAMPKTGDCVFYAAAKIGYGLNSGQNGIFCYQITNGSTSLVAKGGRTSLDAQLAVSGDGTVLAFRSLENSISIVRKKNGTWEIPETYPITDKSSCYPSINGDGRFVAYQCMADGAVQCKIFDVWRRECTMVIESSGGDCARPAISSNGEYVAFTSNAIDDGKWQVFRVRNVIADSGEDRLILDLKKGWNLKSLPFTADDSSWLNLKEIGPIWIWNGRRFSAQLEVVRQGDGFWIYSDSARRVFLKGSVEEPTPLRSGWNLVSPQCLTENLSGRPMFRYDDRKSCYVRYEGHEVDSTEAVWLFMP